MADIVIKNVPATIAEKFSKAKEVSYKDLIQAYEEDGWIDYPVNMDIKEFYSMIKNYDGSKTA
jgi:hypothetical protein